MRRGAGDGQALLPCHALERVFPHVKDPTVVVARRVEVVDPSDAFGGWRQRRRGEDLVGARHQPDLAAMLRDVQEHVGTGILDVAHVDDEAHACGAVLQADVPEGAVVVDAAHGEPFGPGDALGGVLPDVKLPAFVRAVGALVVDSGDVLGKSILGERRDARYEHRERPNRKDPPGNAPPDQAIHALREPPKRATLRAVGHASPPRPPAGVRLPDAVGISSPGPDLAVCHYCRGA